MRLTLQLLLICLVPLAVMGQESVQKQPEPQVVSEQSAPPSTELPAEAPVVQPFPPAQYPQPAPKPGHPLDPNDVAILTGHAASGNANRSPYPNTIVYTYMGPYSYGYSNRTWFGPGQRFGFNGFLFSRRPGPFVQPFFGGPFGRFSFTGFAVGPH